LVYLLLSTVIVFDEAFDLVPLPVVSPPPVVYAKVLGPFRIVDVLVVFAFLTMLAYRTVVLGRSVRWANPLRGAIRMWGGALALALVVAVLRGDRGLGFFFWKNLILGAMVFVVTINAFTSLRQLDQLLTFVSWLLWAKAAGLVLLYLLGRGIYPTDDVGRTVTLWSSPAMGFFTMAAAFWLGKEVLRASRGSGGNMLLIVKLTPLLLAIVFSTRRGAILLFLLTLVAIVWLGATLRDIRRLVHALSVVAVLASAAVTFFREDFAFAMSRMFRLRQVLEMQVGANDAAKLLEYVDAYYNIRRNPVLGAGLAGTFESQFWLDKVWSGVHVGFLEAWLRMGLLGAVAYLGYVFRYVRLASRSMPVLSAAAPGLAGVVLFGALYLIVTVVAIPGPFVFQSAVLAFFCSGILVVAWELLTGHDLVVTTPSRTTTRIPSSV
jgi:hypothetical protein